MGPQIRQRLNYSTQTIVAMLLSGAAASVIVGLYSTPTNRPIAYAWVFLALVGLFYSIVAIRQGTEDLRTLGEAGVTDASTGFDLATLVFKRAHVRSMVLYAIAHATLLQVGVAGIVMQTWFKLTQLEQWFRIYTTASLLFALFTLSLNLVLDSTVHSRMQEAERTKEA